MGNTPDVLELLRSRLADLEAHQRSGSDASARAFWDRFLGGVPSASPSGSGSSDASGRPRGRSRTVAPESRPASRGHGPWSDVPPETLASLDARDYRWQDSASYEQMVHDPAWIEDTAHRAATQAGRRPLEPNVPLTTEAVVGMPLDGHHEAELIRAAEWVAHQRADHEVMLVNLVSELVARGISAPGGLSRTDWLRAHDATLTPGQAKAFVTVGRALTEARWARLRLLVTTQQITVGKAAQIVDFHERTAPVADPDDLATALDDLTEQAARLRPEELARLVRHHTEQVKPPRDEDKLDGGRRAARGLWFAEPNATGMVGMRGMLDPESAAVLKAAIDPLSIPCPTTDEHGRTIEPDDRTPARRRLDALMAFVARGVASADGVPTTDKAKVVVILDYDTLIGDVGGTGTTLTDDVLSAGVVRRMACDAEIIPVVLGGDSEPLDVGRSRRLFTRGQRLALMARDKGCSFPGCTVPATWCDAHHVVHWVHGGRTSVLNGALLCPKHHTHVHEHDLTATVTPTGVTWHT